MNDLVGFGLPFLYFPKSEEEKIEEARRSGYIRSNDPHDINPNREQLCCKACGSLNVSVGNPIYLDDEKGIEIPYLCLNCGYADSRVAQIKNIEDSSDGGTRLVVDLVPNGLVGIAGSLINTN